MKLLTSKKQKEVLDNADYIFEAVDTRNEDMAIEAALKAVEIIYFIGGDKALKKSSAWKKYMATFEEKLKRCIEHTILYGSEVKHGDRQRRIRTEEGYCSSNPADFR